MIHSRASIQIFAAANSAVSLHRKGRVPLFLLIFMIVIFIWALFSHGIYFPEDIYSLTIPVSIVGILYIFYGWLRGEWKEKKAGSWLILMPLFYLFTLFFAPESVKGTIDQIILWTCLSAISFFLFKLGEDPQGVSRLRLIVNVFSVVLLSASYFVIVGFIQESYFIMDLTTEVSGLGERLGGFLQYPNAFGSLLGSLILFLLLIRNKEKVGLLERMSTASLPGLISLFLMTESRGAWIVFILSWMLSLFFLRFEKQLHYILSSVSSIALGGCLYYIFLLDGSIMGSIWDLATLIFISTVFLFIDRMILIVKQSSKIKPWNLPVFMLVFVLLLITDFIWHGLFYRMLPNAIQNRISMGGGAFSERVLYWKDALSHVHEFLWTGLGGDGWNFFMYRVQTQPYLTSEIHNGYLNLLLELGIFGFGLILFLIGWVSIRMVKTRSPYTIPFIFLLLHGFIDFTFSYGIIFMFLLLYIALFCSEEKVLPWGFKHAQAVNKISILVLCIFLVAGAWFSVRILKGQELSKQAEQQHNEEIRTELLSEAIRLNPWNSVNRIQLLENIQPTRQKLDLLEKGLKYEPYHGYMLFEYAQSLHEEGNIKKAIVYYHSAMKSDRFDVRKYERFMEIMSADFKVALTEGNQQAASQYLNEGLNAYNNAKKLESGINQNITNQREFVISSKMNAMNQELLTYQISK